MVAEEARHICTRAWRCRVSVVANLHYNTNIYGTDLGPNIKPFFGLYRPYGLSKRFTHPITSSVKEVKIPANEMPFTDRIRTEQPLYGLHNCTDSENV